MSTSRAGLLPRRCYQGVVPAAIATCAADGTPNVTYLSQVFYIDDEHVALSCQFFNKTKQNILENPLAEVQVHDPVTFEAYRLRLRYQRAETSGPLFEMMASRIQAIASHTGMAGVFRLLSADVYHVLDSVAVPTFLMPQPEGLTPAVAELAGGPRSELRGLQAIAQATARACDLPQLLATLFETLEDAFGFAHAMVLLVEPDGAGAERLRLAGSHGYDGYPPGASVLVGDGLLGTAARERRVLRFGSLPEQLRYGRAVRSAAQQAAGPGAVGPEQPLPGLPDSRSHLALPLVSAERLVGVLAFESREPLAFDDWDEAFLEIVAAQVATALDCARLRATEGTAPTPAASASATNPPATNPPASTEPAPAPAGAPLHIRFFPRDDCVFVEGEYLVRNVPGKVLWKLLRAHTETGRSEFSNRELRLDPWLGLPPVRDNLESRLSLLRKRLEERCPDIRVEQAGRGRFVLRILRPLVLTEEADLTG